MGFAYGGEAEIRTLGAVTLNGFQDRRFRPLSHLTGGRKLYLWFREWQDATRFFFHLFVIFLIWG